MFLALGALPEAVERAERDILKPAWSENYCTVTTCGENYYENCQVRSENYCENHYTRGENYYENYCSAHVATITSQVFLALGALPEAVERAEREMLKLARSAVATALDTSTLGEASDEKVRER